MKTIILASGSPRRKELLEKTGIRFKVVKSNFKEYVDPKLKPHTLAKKLSLEKAKEVLMKHKKCIIIAADTLVAYRGKALGKPKDENDARKMLEFLSGKVHLIITGFTIIDGNSHQIITKSQETKIHMKRINSEDINTYIQTKEPFDKAGAYAIQEKGSIFIKKIEGNFDNAVGLPVHALMRELKKFDIKPVK